MNFELSNALSDLEVLKEKIDDVLTSFVWFNDEYFTHDPSYMLNKKDILEHGWRYHEHRIKNSQTIDLMLMYQKDFGQLIERFKEIEKASSENFAEESDNAKKDI